MRDHIKIWRQWVIVFGVVLDSAMPFVFRSPNPKDMPWGLATFLILLMGFVGILIWFIETSSTWNASHTIRIAIDGNGKYHIQRLYALFGWTDLQKDFKSLEDAQECIDIQTFNTRIRKKGKIRVDCRETEIPQQTLDKIIGSLDEDGRQALAAKLVEIDKNI